jgi:hypothetical protein
MTLIMTENRRRCVALSLAALLALTSLASLAAAQSTDPFNPTPMTADTVKGRWPADKLISHYYSIVAGPGVVKVMFNCVDDSGSQIVGQEVTDADNHLLKRRESIGSDSEPPTYVTEVASGAGVRLVSTYELKRRQKLIVRFYTAITTPETGGSYTIKVSGEGISANEPSTLTNSYPANREQTISLPKSGKLRLVMDDGTVQEINLSRVREATVNP